MRFDHCFLLTTPPRNFTFSHHSQPCRYEPPLSALTSGSPCLGQCPGEVQMAQPGNCVSRCTAKTPVLRMAAGTSWWRPEVKWRSCTQRDRRCPHSSTISNAPLANFRAPSHTRSPQRESTLFPNWHPKEYNWV